MDTTTAKLVHYLLVKAYRCYDVMILSLSTWTWYTVHMDITKTQLVHNFSVQAASTHPVNFKADTTTTQCVHQLQRPNEDTKVYTDATTAERVHSLFSPSIDFIFCSPSVYKQCTPCVYTTDCPQGRYHDFAFPDHCRMGTTAISYGLCLLFFVFPRQLPSWVYTS
ncbi:Uncharacterized protein Rs2_01392 [Raphanus sativus]|nr:Uncharacterized protein Rs2_01392 [Raphanus sativus]